MVYSWSHTEEGVQNIKKGIMDLKDNILKDIFSRIMFHKISNLLMEVEDTEYTEDIPYFTTSERDIIKTTIENSEYLKDLIAEYHVNKDNNRLVNFIFKYASEELRECDTGGYNAYLDPDYKYSVPFGYNFDVQILNSCQIEYKGFIGKVEYDLTEDCFCGYVIFRKGGSFSDVIFKDVITYKGRTKKELLEEFRNSVDDYLEMISEL